MAASQLDVHVLIFLMISAVLTVLQGAPAKSDNSTAATASNQTSLGTGNLAAPTADNITLIPTMTVNCPQVNRSSLPLWYQRDITDESDQIACRIRATQVVNATTNRTTFVFTSSGLPYDIVQACRDYPNAWRLQVMMDFYWIIYKIGTPFASTTAGSIFIHGPIGYMWLILVPASVMSQYLGMRVLNILMKRSESQIYTYHRNILVMDFLLFLFNTGLSSGLGDILYFPLCFMSPVTASSFKAIPLSAAQFVLHGLGIGTNVLQAFLAIDRALALYVPLSYELYSSRSLTLRVTTASWLIGLAVALEGVLTVPEIVKSLYFTTTGMILASNAHAPVYADYGTYSSYIRMTIGTAALLIQVAGSLAVGIAICKRKRSVVRKKCDTGLPMTPFYLLLSTCFLNGFAQTCEIVSQILQNAGPAQTTLQSILVTAPVVVVPLCSFAMVYAHCACSSVFRDQMKTELICLLKTARVMPKSSGVTQLSPKATSSIALTSSKFL